MLYTYLSLSPPPPLFSNLWLFIYIYMWISNPIANSQKKMVLTKLFRELKTSSVNTLILFSSIDKKLIFNHMLPTFIPSFLSSLFQVHIYHRDGIKNEKQTYLIVGNNYADLFLILDYTLFTLCSHTTCRIISKEFTGWHTMVQ